MGPVCNGSLSDKRKSSSFSSAVEVTGLFSFFGILNLLLSFKLEINSSMSFSDSFWGSELLGSCKSSINSLFSKFSFIFPGSSN